MPLIRIDMPATRFPEVPVAFGVAVQQAPHDALGVLIAERFQVVAERSPGGLVVGPGHLGVARSAEAVVILVMLDRGRDADIRRHFFRTLADTIHAGAGLRREDLVVSLVGSAVRTGPSAATKPSSHDPYLCSSTDRRLRR